MASSGKAESGRNAKERVRKSPAPFRQRIEAPLVVRWPKVGSEVRAEVIKLLRGFGGEELDVVGTLSDGGVVKSSVAAGHVSAEPPYRLANERRRRHKPLRARQALYCGVNEVTKALERLILGVEDEDGGNPPIASVVCALDVSPAVLTQHIPPLCARAGIPLVAVPALSAELGEVVGTASVIAVGLRSSLRPGIRAKGSRDPEQDAATARHLATTLKYLREHAQPIELPWIRPAADETGPEFLLQPLRVEHVPARTPSRPLSEDPAPLKRLKTDS